MFLDAIPGVVLAESVEFVVKSAGGGRGYDFGGGYALLSTSWVEL